jgi:hypothetical protein
MVALSFVQAAARKVIISIIIRQYTPLVKEVNSCVSIEVVWNEGFILPVK